MLCKSPLLDAQFSTVYLMPGMHFESLPAYFTACTRLTFSELILAQNSIFHVFFIQSILHSCMLTEEDRNVYWLSHAERNENSFCNVALN